MRTERRTARSAAKKVIATGSRRRRRLGLLAFAHARHHGSVLAAAVLGSNFGPMFAALAKPVVRRPPAQTGVASGMNANIRTIGGAFGAAISATILAASATGGGAPTEAAYEVTFLVMAGAMAVATLACVLMPRAGTAEPDAPPPPYSELALQPGARGAACRLRRRGQPGPHRALSRRPTTPTRRRGARLGVPHARRL